MKNAAFWVLEAALVLALVLLTGCAAGKSSEPPIDEIRIQITLDTEDEVYLLVNDNYVDGELASGSGVQDADGRSSLGETCGVTLHKRDFPEGADLTKITVRLYLADKPDTSGNLEALAGHEGMVPVEPELAIPARFGGTVRVTVTGSFDEGFTATLKEAQDG